MTLLTKLFRSGSPWMNWIIVPRVIAGYMIFKFGFELFNADGMRGYGQWLTDVNVPAPLVMAYVGKIGELVGGLFLMLGFLTRFASLTLVIVMAVITWVMGDGEFFSFTNAMMMCYATFFFCGAGKFSVDYFLFDRSKGA